MNRINTIDNEYPHILDRWITDYLSSRFEKDFESLTPLQRISVVIKILGTRLPKFKAIDLHSSSGIRMEDVEKCVGRLLKPHFPD